MKLLRWASGLGLLVATVAVIVVDNPFWLVGALVMGFALRAGIWRNLSASLRSTLPVVLFAVVMVLMQWLARVPVTSLAAKTLTVFLFSTAAFRLLPWTDAVTAVQPRTVFHGFLLYLLFIRHFVNILTGETSRLLQARSLCPPRAGCRRRRAHRDSWRIPHASNRTAPCRGVRRRSSLAWGLASLFSRSLARAERFYAAQLLRGFAE